MTAILIGASIPHEPLVRPLALPVPLFFTQVGLELLVSAVANARGTPAPFKMSSVEKGERVPPLVLTIVEDIVGVDGAATKSYRKRLVDRYAASPRFRAMIKGLTWFWGVGALVDGVGTLVVVCTVPQEVAYGVGECFSLILEIDVGQALTGTTGWGSPLIFVIIWVFITVHWVHKSLRREKKLWLENYQQQRCTDPVNNGDNA